MNTMEQFKEEIERKEGETIVEETTFEDPDWLMNLNISDEDNIENLIKLIRLMKKYRDEKIFDHLNVPASFVPIAGPITNIIHGARRGNTSEIVLGSVFLTLDVFTLGTASLLKTLVTSTEKIAVVTASHTGDIARGIRQGAKGLMWLPKAAGISKNAAITATAAKGALQTGKVVGVGVKVGTTVISSSNALRLGSKKFNNEEQEIINLVILIRNMIGEELYNNIDENIIKYINNPICHPLKLKKIIVRLSQKKD